MLQRAIVHFGLKDQKYPGLSLARGIHLRCWIKIKVWYEFRLCKLVKPVSVHMAHNCKLLTKAQISQFSIYSTVDVVTNIMNKEMLKQWL